MKTRRDKYLGAMAYLFGYTPAQIDDMTVVDFEGLAAWVDAYLKAQAKR